MLSFCSPSGTDSAYYLQYAAQCAAGGDCWNSFRPAGFILYASLPYRMGWSPESLILMNLFLMALSTLLAGRAWNVLVPALKRRSWIYSPFKYAFIGVAHLLFMWGAARVAISDVPAACAGLISVWLFILACGRNSALWLAGSGFFLGAATSFRAFYYYPAYFFFLAAAFACFKLRRIAPSALAAFVLLAAFPILSQFALTSRHTGSWSLLEPRTTAYFEGSEMNLTAYGTGVVNNDPVYGVDGVGNDQLHWYTCGDCMNGTGGWVGALKRLDFRGIVKLAWMRNAFYFGSYVAQPAIASLKDRIFSVWIELANWFAVLAAAALLWRIRNRWILGVPLFFVASVWGLSIFIHPESRFIMLVLTLAWSLAPLAFLAGMDSDLTAVSAGAGIHARVIDES